MKNNKDSSLNLLKVLTSNDGLPENMDLSLGLSLNGRYGWDPQSNKDNKLLRASSVRDMGNIDIELTLSRTCSLPVETEVEWKKRKELEMLRRLDVKRKRVDQKLKKWSSPLLISKPMPLKLMLEKVKVYSQGSIGSQGSGGGSSGVSDLDSRPLSGTNRDTSETNERPEVNKEDGPDDKRIIPNSLSVIDQTMPCVSTKEDGPDGKRIQGFLYRYGNGQEVRIVCVCHGSFLTPAEFVKHGGRGDVEHPLRHIVVTSSLFS